MGESRATLAAGRPWGRIRPRRVLSHIPSGLPSSYGYSLRAALGVPCRSPPSVLHQKNGRKKGLKGLFCELTQLLENIGIEPYAIKIALSGRTLPAMPGRSKAALREGTLAPSLCSTGARARLGPASSKQEHSRIHTYCYRGPCAMSLKGPYGIETFEASMWL